MLTEKRKADREVMARKVEELCTGYGAKCERSPFHGSREIRLDIRLGDATVGVDFDGDNSRSLLDNYCLPWCMDFDSHRRFSWRFGASQGAEVNPFHRRKCTAFARGIDELLHKLRSGFDLIESRRAFEAEAEAA